MIRQQVTQLDSVMFTAVQTQFSHFGRCGSRSFNSPMGKIALGALFTLYYLLEPIRHYEECLGKKGLSGFPRAASPNVIMKCAAIWFYSNYFTYICNITRDTLILFSAGFADCS